MPRRVPLVPAVAVTAVLTGCSVAPQGEEVAGTTVLVGTPPAAAAPVREVALGALAGPNDTLLDPTRGTPPGVGGPYGRARDGVWRVGHAGAVTVRVTGEGTLELVDVAPAAGWEVTDEELERDTVEVDLRRGAIEQEIEVEVDGGLLQVEIDQDVEPAPHGVVHVGEAARVELLREGSALVLGRVGLDGGWTEISRAESRHAVSLDFRRQGDGVVEVWELDAGVEDGELEVEVDYEVRGRISP